MQIELSPKREFNFIAKEILILKLRENRIEK